MNNEYLYIYNMLMNSAVPIRIDYLFILKDGPLYLYIQGLPNCIRVAYSVRIQCVTI